MTPAEHAKDLAADVNDVDEQVQDVMTAVRKCDARATKAALFALVSILLRMQQNTRQAIEAVNAQEAGMVVVTQAS